MAKNKIEYAKSNQEFYGCKCAEGFQGLCSNHFLDKDGNELCKLAIIPSKNNNHGKVNKRINR